MSTNRVKAIQDEKKHREDGDSNRKWYIEQAVLDELNMKQFKSKEGSSFLAIIPPLDPDKYFGLKIYVHYNIGANTDAYLCPKMMKNQKCTLCERREQLIAKGATKEIAKAFSCFPPRYLFLVVDMTSADTEAEGVQLYDSPQTINDEILGLSQNKRTGEIVDISDPKSGKVLVFDRKGMKATDTKYSAFSLEDREPLSKEWLGVADVEEFLHYGTEKEILESLGAVAREEGADSAEDAAPEQPTRRPIARTRTSAVEEPAEAKEKEPATEPAVATPRRRVSREAVAESTAAAQVAPVEMKETSEPTEDDVRKRLKERLAKRRTQQEG